MLARPRSTDRAKNLGGVLRRTLTVAALLVAALTVTMQLRSVLDLYLGVDFFPLRHAGEAMLHGRSVYGDKTFVYPPSAAPLFVALTWGAEPAAGHLWTLVNVIALTLAGIMVGFQARRGYRVFVAAGAVVALAGGVTALDSLPLGNLSPLLAPAYLGVLLCFDRSRWRAGCVLLACSVLVKPLLVPLALVPVVRRRVADLAIAAVGALLLLGVAILVVPGGRRVDQFVSYILHGTNLHGGNAVNNIALAGWAEVHHVNGGVTMAGRVLILLLAVGALTALVRRRVAGCALEMGTLVFLAVLLAGGISEMHYLLCVLAGCLASIVRRPSWARAVAYAPGAVLLSIPVVYSGIVFDLPFRQNWYVAAEVLLFIGAVVDTAMLVRRRPATEQAPASSKLGGQASASAQPAAGAARSRPNPPHRPLCSARRTTRGGHR